MTFSSPIFLLFLLVLPIIARNRHVGAWARGIRIVLLTLLILGIAGLQLVQKNEHLAVVFLVDVSDSMPANAQEKAQQWVKDAIAEMPPDDQAAIVLFGADALVERPMRPMTDWQEFASTPLRIETDLQEAIRLGLALFPSGMAKRMVILSDGIETVGSAQESARLAATSHVQLQVVPFDYTRENEVLIADAHAPTRVRQGARFSLDVAVTSTVAQTAQVRVLEGASVIYSGSHELQQGNTHLLLPLTATKTGFSTYRVQVVAPNDTFLLNNELESFTQVEGPPRVLVVSSASKEIAEPAQHLIRALEDSKWEVAVGTPAGLPSDLGALAAYASIVLVDVPASQLTPRQQLALQQYVRDLGGGLVAIGGTQSYGVGGYYKTPLEEVLPVEMQLKDKKRRPQIAMVFVIDHSGSMEDGSGGANKLELAKEATMRSIELLSPGDHVGVVIFDDSAQWVVPMQEMDDPQSIISRVGSIRSGGGTDILAGLQAVASELPDDESAVKHVILLTDGQAPEDKIPQLVTNLNQSFGITISTVGVGQGAAAFLPDLAKLGQGRYHFVADPSSIPEIFTSEVALTTRSYIIEETFFPLQTAQSSLLQGIPALPAIHGYIGTSPKASANTILVSNTKDGYHDPLLASWQYGLGKSVAWTSDATGRWASEWVAWEGFGGFWRQVVDSTIGDTLASDLSMQVTRREETATLHVTAIDLNGESLNELALEANIIDPNGTTTTTTLVQVAAGEYQAEFEPTMPGAYLLRVSGGEAFAGQTGGWVLRYSPEYQIAQPNPAALQHLASLTDGGIAESPKAVFTHDLPATFTTLPIWQPLLLLAAILLPLDVAVRRLFLTREEWARLRGIFRWQRAAKDSPNTAQKTTLSRLRDAKARVQPPPSPKKVITPTEPTPNVEDDSPAAPAKPSPDSLARTLLERKKK